MSLDFDIEKTIKPFVKGSSLGLMICSLILLFIHYNFNKYFGFLVPNWIVFILWIYFIGNSIALFLFLRNNLFECPNCKRRHKERKNG